MTMNSPATSRFSSLHHVEVLHVLAGDGRDGDVVDVDLVAADEVQQQVERAPRTSGSVDPRRVLGERRLHPLRDLELGRLLRWPARRGGMPSAGTGSSSGREARRWPPRSVSARSTHRTAVPIFMASRTSSMVAWATSRARLEPSCRMSHHRVRVRGELRPPRVDLLEPRQHVLEQHALAVEAADARGAAARRAAQSCVSRRARRPCAGRRPGRCRGCRDRCAACARDP